MIRSRVLELLAVISQCPSAEERSVDAHPFVGRANQHEVARLAAATIFVLGDDTVAIRYEAWEAERTVYLDGREADPNEDIALLGHSTGSWEGDTLVVETTGFTENLNNLPDFFYYGNGGRLIERYSVDENGSLVIEITFTEPEYLDGPWNVVKKQARMEDYELLEYKCVDRGHGDDIR